MSFEAKTTQLLSLIIMSYKSEFSMDFWRKYERALTIDYWYFKEEFQTRVQQI